MDASQLLPGLRRTPGLRRWRPFDKQKQAFFDTHEEARAVRIFFETSSVAFAPMNLTVLQHGQLHILFVVQVVRHAVSEAAWAHLCRLQ